MTGRENNIQALTLLTFNQYDAMAHLRVTGPAERLGIRVLIGYEQGTLHPEQINWILGLLKERDITYVTFEGEDEGHPLNLEPYDALLELKEGGDWTWEPTRGGRLGKMLSLLTHLSER